MKTWRLITGVALVLVLGILIGSAGTRIYLRHTHRLFHPRDRAAHIMGTLSRELDLSQAQKTAVQNVLQRTSEKLHAHYLQQRPEAERIVGEGFSEIRLLLTDEQKKKFDTLQERYRRHRRPPDW